MKVLKCLVCILTVFLAGCGSAPPVKPADTPKPPQVEFTSAAPLVATLKQKAAKIELEGTAAHSPEAKLLVTGLDTIQFISGHADPIKLSADPLELASQLDIIQTEVYRELTDRLVALENYSLKKDEAAEALAAKTQEREQSNVTFKLIAIGIATALAVGGMIWWTPTRAFAPIAGIVGAALFFIVVLGAIVADILLVALVAGGLCAAYLVVLYIVARRKAEQKARIADTLEGAIEKANDATLKTTVAAEARTAGVADALHADLLAKGFAK